MIYRILDIFFVLLHTSLIIFSTIGWLWKRLRIWNLILLLLTGSSWLFLGLLKGTLGYCPLTDWHFSVLEKLGKTALPLSYIEYLAERLTGHDFNSIMVDRLTLDVYLAVLMVSVIFNISGWMRLRKTK